MAITSKEEHVKDLKMVLDLHSHTGIKSTAKKTHLFKEEGNYLELNVTKTGIGIESKYIDKILEWPTLIIFKQLNSLLGFINYYWSFINDFSILTAEMNT